MFRNKTKLNAINSLSIATFFFLYFTCKLCLALHQFTAKQIFLCVPQQPQKLCSIDGLVSQLAVIYVENWSKETTDFFLDLFC